MPFSWIRIFLLPLTVPAAVLYACVTFLRNLFFDFGILNSYDCGPVASIGNITAGGTGKTPLTARIAKELLKRDVQIGIVSRGYKREKHKDVEEVSLPSDGSLNEASRRYGDEPTWLAQNLAPAPVYVGNSRLRAIASLKAKYKRVQLVLADDAFQHRKLKRFCNIVVIDATAPKWHYLPIPLGFGREDFSHALKRSNFIVLTKTNLAEKDSLNWIKGKLAAHPRVLEMQSQIKTLRPLNEGSLAILIDDFSGKKAFLLSGIANPKSFSQLIELGGIQIVGSLALEDHAVFSEEVLSNAEKGAMAYQADCIVVTQKDSVKIRGWKPQLPVFVSDLEMLPLTSMEPLYALLVSNR